MDMRRSEEDLSIFLSLITSFSRESLLLNSTFWLGWLAPKLLRSAYLCSSATTLMLRFQEPVAVAHFYVGFNLWSSCSHKCPYPLTHLPRLLIYLKQDLV